MKFESKYNINDVVFFLLDEKGKGNIKLKEGRISEICLSIGNYNQSLKIDYLLKYYYNKQILINEENVNKNVKELFKKITKTVDKNIKTKLTND